MRLKTISRIVLFICTSGALMMFVGPILSIGFGGIVGCEFFRSSMEQNTCEQIINPFYFGLFVVIFGLPISGGAFAGYIGLRLAYVFGKIPESAFVLMFSLLIAGVIALTFVFGLLQRPWMIILFGGVYFVLDKLIVRLARVFFRAL